MTGHQYIRHLLQARTAAQVSTLNMDDAVAQAYQALQRAIWRETELQDATMPRHNWAQTGFSASYDAFRFCGDYADGYQHAYAGAVDYVVTIPEDAQEGAACTITALAVRAYGDRYLGDGAILAVIPSASPLPPTWAEVLAATEHTDDVDPILKVATVSNDGTDSTEDVALTLTTPIDAHAYGYLHLVLRVVNYESHRGAWIEGGASLSGASIDITYSRAVAADDTTLCPMLGVSRLVASADPGPTYVGWDQVWRQVGIRDPAPGDTPAATQAAMWATATAGWPTMATAVTPASLGGDAPIGAYLSLDAEGFPAIYGAARFFAAGLPDGRRFRTLTLGKAIPAKTTGTRPQIALYALTGITIADALLPIAPTTVATLAFWQGGATAITVGATVATATALVRYRADAAVAADYKWPIDFVLSAPTMFLFVVSLSRVCSSPGYVPGERYGLIYAPDLITLQE